MTKVDKIRRFLNKGQSAKVIAKKLDVSPAYVHYVNRKVKREDASESRKAVLKRTMPKKLIVKPQHLDDALKVLGGKFKVTPRNFTKAEIEALGGREVFNTLGTDDEVRKALDLVNHPPHYKAGGIETIDFIEAKDLNFRLGNVIKYVARAEKKGDPLEDLKKARWYLEREIAVRERA